MLNYYKLLLIKYSNKKLELLSFTFKSNTLILNITYNINTKDNV